MELAQCARLCGKGKLSQLNARDPIQLATTPAKLVLEGGTNTYHNDFKIWRTNLYAVN